MTKPRRSLENSGKSINYVTTGGAGYVPPAINANDVINKLSNFWNYSKTYLKNKFAGTDDGTFIDLSDKNVSRIKSNTKNVDTILTNEFVEKNKNTVRKKKDFVNTTDTLLGDKKIPLSKISTFYGVEDGKLKAGPLASFKDETVIVPNRTKNIGRVKKILMAPPGTNKSIREKQDSIINAYNQKHGYTQGTFSDIINTIFPWTDPEPPGRVLFRAEGRNAISRVLNESGEELKHIGNKAITESGDTIPLININATPKVMFANEQGKAGFLSNIRNRRNVEALNRFLSKNPSYPIMVDNGRYATYMDNLPNAEIYGGLNRPDDMFIIGTINRAKHKYGGKTNNSNNMPKRRIHLDEVKPYVIPTDNIQIVKPDTTDIEYPNFVFSSNNPNFGIYTGLGYNAYGEMIDYNNNGVPASQEYIIDKIKTKYYKNPSQRRVNNAKKAISVRPDFKNGGSIHIDPSKKGTFTAAASKHNMSVQEFASRVLRNKENYSPAMVKKANFARNASKWNH